MDSFNWLHLSDLHWGQPDQALFWPNIRQAFFDDLEKLHEKRGPWHAVLFTGDLVYAGQNFPQMQAEVLQPLWDELRRLGSEPVLLAVPGNHDLARPDTSTDPHAGQLVAPGDFQTVAEEFWEEPKSPYRRVVDQAFVNYIAWWNEQPYRVGLTAKPGLLPGDFSATCRTPEGRQIGILGLNTAFWQLAAGDYLACLACDVRQFHAACDPDGTAWANNHHACILMTHHGRSWLNTESYETMYPEIYPAGRFCAHLFGHMHDEVIRGESRGGPAVRYWQAASLFSQERYLDRDGKRAVRRRHGYSANRLEFDGERVTLRHWPRKATFDGTNPWQFVPDYECCYLEDDEGTREEIQSDVPPRSPRIEIVESGCIRVRDNQGNLLHEFPWDLAANTRSKPQDAREWKRLHTQAERLYKIHRQLVAQMLSASVSGDAQYSKAAETLLVTIDCMYREFVSELRQLSKPIRMTRIIRELLWLPVCVAAIRESLADPIGTPFFQNGFELAKRIEHWLLDSLHFADQVLEKHFNPS